MMRTKLVVLSLLLMALAAPSALHAQLQPISTKELRIGYVSPTTNYISLQAPAVTTTYTLTLPAAVGSNGQVLTTNASGALSWVTPSTVATAMPLSGLTAATVGNTINSANFTQTWQWNTLAGGSALVLSSSSTAATGNTQTILDIQLTGANATATQTTYGATISNAHTGTTSTNVSLELSATGGTNNYALIASAGNVGIGTTTPTNTLQVNGTFLTAGGAVSINDNATTNTVSIGGGTTTGAVTIGGTGTQTISIGNGAGVKTVNLGSNNTTSTTAILSGSGGLTLNASNNQPTSINTGTSTGAVSIGNTANTVTIGSLGTALKSSLGTNDRVVIANASGQLDQASFSAVVAAGTWVLTGNATADAWNGTTGTRIGTTSAFPLVLATTNATAQDIRFFTGASGANERLRITGAGDVVVGFGEAAGAGSSITLRAPDLSGSNRTGIDLVLRAGNGTGSGSSGAITFSTSTAGSGGGGSAANLISERMRITPDGLVLIGAASGTATLDVTGTFDVTGNSTIGGTLGVTGATTLTTLNGVASASVPVGYDRIVLANNTGLLSEATIASVVAAGLGSNAVTSFSAGTTGLTPSTATTGAVTLAGTLAVANGGTGVTTSTGTGSVVLSTSPALTTPNLGTPSAATLTNATGLPISTGVSGLGTGVATMLATPSSANIATAVTDETGSGALVFATSPTVTTLTVSSGGIDVTGNSIFTGTLTAETATTTQDQITLQAAAAGAARFVGTITNADLTAARTYTLPNASGTIAVSASGNIALSAAGDVSLTGQVPIANGGTGAADAPTARTNLGATTVGSNLFTLTNPSAVTFLRVNADNTVSALTAANFLTAIGAGTGSGTVTSVGLSMPAIFSVTNSPVTTSGTLTATLATQTANTVFAGPTTGVAAAPTFRALVAADVPSLDASKITTGTLGVANGGTGSSTQNFVDLTTEQNSIGGAKTFTSALTASAGATVSGGAVSINDNATTNTVSIGGGTTTGAVTIGGTGTQTISVGNGAGVKTVNLGSSNNTSTTTILSGSGGVSINENNNQPTDINTGTSTGAVTIGGTGVMNINIGAGGTGAKTITIGDGASTGSTSISAGSGGISLTGATTLANNNSLRLAESTANGSNFIGFKGPSSVAADVTWTLPGSDGTNGQFLSTNGSGTLSWASVVGGVSSTGTAGYLTRFSSATSFENGLIYDTGTNLGIGTTSPGAMLDVRSPSAGTVGLAIRAAASPTANLLEIENSTGGVLVAVSSGGSLTLSPTGTSAGATNDLRFQELAANGSNYVALKAPDNIETTETYTLPSADGASGDVLTTDGAGVTSWTTPRIVTKVLTSDASNTTVTLSSITGLELTVGTGTYKFEYNVVYQSAATNNGVGFGVDLTGGTATLYIATHRFSSTGTTAATGVATGASTVANTHESQAGRTLNALIGTFNVGVAAANVNNLSVVEGIITVSASGTLKILYRSETAGTAITVKAGTALILTKLD